jgi:hypothetical protein
MDPRQTAQHKHLVTRNSFGNRGHINSGQLHTNPSQIGTRIMQEHETLLPDRARVIIRIPDATIPIRMSLSAVKVRP